MPKPIMLTLGERELRAALLLPGGAEPGRAAPRPARPVRRAARRAGAQGPEPVPRVAVDRRRRVRGPGRRRPRRRRTRTGVGPRGEVRLRARARGPGRRAARRGRAVPVPRPRARRDPRVVLRRLPRGDGGPSPPGRVPRGRGRRAGDRPAPLRHVLHGALPRPSRRAPRGVRAELDPRRGAAAHPAAPADPRARRRQRVRRAHAEALGGAVRGRPAPRAGPDPERDAHDALDRRHREPPPASSSTS